MYTNTDFENTNKTMNQTRNHTYPDSVTKPLSGIIACDENDLVNFIIPYIKHNKRFNDISIFSKEFDKKWKSLSSFEQEQQQLMRNALKPILAKVRNSTKNFTEILVHLSKKLESFINRRGREKRSSLPRFIRRYLVGQECQHFFKIKHNDEIIRRDFTLPSLKRDVGLQFHHDIQRYDGEVIAELTKYTTSVLNIEGRYSIKTQLGFSYSQYKETFKRLELNFLKFKKNDSENYLRLKDKDNKLSIKESLSLLTYSILLHILYYEGTEHQHIDNLENLLKYYKICNSYKQHKKKADKGALKRLWSEFCKEVLKIFPQVCDFLFKKQRDKNQRGRFDFKTLFEGSSVKIEKTDVCHSVFSEYNPISMSNIDASIEMWFIKLIHKVKIYLNELNTPLKNILAGLTSDDISAYCKSLDENAEIAKQLCSVFDRINDFIKIFNASSRELKYSFGYKQILSIWEQTQPIRICYLMSYKDPQNSYNNCEPFVGFNNGLTLREFQQNMIHNSTDFDNYPFLLNEAPTGSGKTSTVILVKHKCRNQDIFMRYITTKEVGFNLVQQLGCPSLKNCTGMIHLVNGYFSTLCGVEGRVFDLTRDSKKNPDDITSKKACDSGNGTLGHIINQQVKHATSKTTERKRKETGKLKDINNSKGGDDNSLKPCYTSIYANDGLLVTDNGDNSKYIISVIDDISIRDLPDEFKNFNIHFDFESEKFYFLESDGTKNIFSNSEQISIFKAFITFQNTYVNQVVKSAQQPTKHKVWLVGATISHHIVKWCEKIYTDHGLTNFTENLSNNVYAGNWPIFLNLNQPFPWIRFFKEHGGIYNKNKQNSNIKRMIVTDENYHLTQKNTELVTSWDRRSTLDDFQNVIDTFRNLDDENDTNESESTIDFTDIKSILRKVFSEIKQSLVDGDNLWCTLIVSNLDSINELLDENDTKLLSKIPEIFSHFENNESSEKFTEKFPNFTYKITKDIIIRLIDINFKCKNYNDNRDVYLLVKKGICNYSSVTNTLPLLKCKYVNILFVDKTSDIHGFDYQHLCRSYIQDGLEPYYIAQSLGRMSRGTQYEYHDLDKKIYISIDSIKRLFEYENQDTDVDNTLVNFLELFRETMFKDASGFVDWNKPNLVISSIASQFKFGSSEKRENKSKGGYQGLFDNTNSTKKPTNLVVINNSKKNKNEPKKDTEYSEADNILSFVDLDFINANNEAQNGDKDIVKEELQTIHPIQKDWITTLEKLKFDLSKPFLDYSIFEIILILTHQFMFYLKDRKKNPIGKILFPYTKELQREINSIDTTIQSQETKTRKIQVFIKFALKAFRDMNLEKEFIANENSKSARFNTILDFTENIYSPRHDNIDMEKYENTLIKLVLMFFLKKIYPEFKEVKNFKYFMNYMTGKKQNCEDFKTTYCTNTRCKAPHYIIEKVFKQSKISKKSRPKSPNKKYY